MAEPVAPRLFPVTVQSSCLGTPNATGMRFLKVRIGFAIATHASLAVLRCRIGLLAQGEHFRAPCERRPQLGFLENSERDAPTVVHPSLIFLRRFRQAQHCESRTAGTVFRIRRCSRIHLYFGLLPRQPACYGLPIEDSGPRPAANDGRFESDSTTSTRRPRIPSEPVQRRFRVSARIESRAMPKFGDTLEPWVNSTS